MTKSTAVAIPTKKAPAKTTKKAPARTQRSEVLVEVPQEAPKQKRISWKARVERNIAWIEAYCLIPEGKFAGQPVKLTKHQRKWMARIYGSATRTFILSMGRKNAKTAFSAFLTLLHLCGPESQVNSQLYSAAQSREQAAVLFELAAKMVRMNHTLSEHVLIRDTAKELVCKGRGTFYKALSAEVSTSFGKSPAFLIHDELGQVKGPRSPLYEALESACAAHDEPLSIIISTQAPTDADLLSILIDDALTGADPTVKVELFTADESLDPFSEEAIRQANPHYDVFMNKEEVRKQARDAQRMPSKEASYRNLNLNQRVEARSPFVARSTWMENAAPPVSGPDYMKPKVFAGLDLASVSDLCAFIAIDEVDFKWNVRPTFWLPEVGLADKSRQDRETYDLWHKQGFLSTTPGRSVEYAYIAKFLRDFFDANDVQAVAFDRYNWRFLKPWLEKPVVEGGPPMFTEEELARFVEFGQGFVSMSPAIRELESLLLAQKLRHGSHPVLNMCCKNTTVVKDPAENRKFVKGKASGRIDGMVALAMAVGVMHNHKPAGPKEPTMFFV